MTGKVPTVGTLSDMVTRIVSERDSISLFERTRAAFRGDYCLWWKMIRLLAVKLNKSELIECLLLNYLSLLLLLLFKLILKI